MELSTKRDLFIKINSAVINCKKCRLCRGRNNAVPGEGNINTDLVIIGEAPGAKEDELGRPFVGRSGQMLNDLLAKIKLSRKQVWIGNVVKCRPPDNRDPMVDEIRACKPYLEKQIDLINPKIVLTLGKFAMEYYLPNEKIAEAHGRVYKVGAKAIYPVYHPAAALRNGTIRKILEKDFMNLQNLLKADLSTIEYANLDSTDEDQLSLF